MAPRYDYAVFTADEFVTNALLTISEAESMELDGFRCLRVRDTPGEGLPRFRHRSYVRSTTRHSARWDR